MALEIEGRILKILPIETGMGSRGEWKKRIFVVETLEQFPRKVAFITWNEKAEALDNLRTGTRVVVQFALESREYNDRWYTDARAYNIKIIEEKDITKISPNSGETTIQEPGNIPSGPEDEPFLDDADLDNSDALMEGFEDDDTWLGGGDNTMGDIDGEDSPGDDILKDDEDNDLPF